MINNYVKIALRYIKRHKGYALINIVGLAIGLASCIMIMLFVRHEFQYDRFNDSAGRIYRVGLKAKIGDSPIEVASSPAPLAAALVNDLPEVIGAARMCRPRTVQVKRGDEVFGEERFYWVDSSLFRLFTIPFREGDAETALAAPNSIVITTEASRKYFGVENPLGEIITVDDGSVYTVTGLVDPFPANAHFHFDFLASLSSLELSRGTDWISNQVYTYVLLQEPASAAEVAARLPEISRKYVGPLIEAAMGVTYEQLIESGSYFGFFLQPLVDIHLHSHLHGELEPTGNMNTVIVFTAVAILILIVACMNFINLATARSMQRACEVGVRKVVGSSRMQLVRQFMFESVFTVSLAAVLALALVICYLPTFNTLVGKTFAIPDVVQLVFLASITGAVLLVGILAGIYPALLLASFRPSVVIKGEIHRGIKGRGFRNAMVVFQFCTSIVLLIGTTVIYTQLRYLQNKALGYEREHIIVIRSALELRGQQEAYKNELLRSPLIENATYASGIPQLQLSASIFNKEGVDSHESYTAVIIQTDYDFMETFKLELAEGRYFIPERSMDTTAIILNEAAIRIMGLKNPLESRLRTSGDDAQVLNVIGVFKDFHLQSLHELVRPLIVGLGDEGVLRFLAVRVRPGEYEGALAYIKSQWSNFLPDRQLDYVFYSDQFQKLYSAEEQTGKILTSFSILAILVACLGLFGLVSFASEQRTKEIGVRKALGASAVSIVLLLSRDFLQWVALANFIAWPVAFFFMNKWLQNFAFRINLQVWMFVVAAACTMLIALCTMSFCAIRAALHNPVDALKYE